jgi:hypothetical protein
VKPPRWGYLVDIQGLIGSFRGFVLAFELRIWRGLGAWASSPDFFVREANLGVRLPEIALACETCFAVKSKNHPPRQAHHTFSLASLSDFARHSP